MLGQKRLLDVDPDDLISLHTAISLSTGRGQTETVVRAQVGAALCRDGNTEIQEDELYYCTLPRTDV